MNISGPRYLEHSKKGLADYINVREDDLVYVSNPGFAANIVAKNFPLKSGDEVLATNIEF